MARMRTYQCPSCDGRFQFMHHPSDEPPPRFCPLCGYDTEGDDTGRLAETLAAPAIKTRYSKGIDDIQKAEEEGARFRAQKAQEDFGLSAEEAGIIANRDMRTDNRAGEDSVVPVNNAVTQVMANPAAQQVGLGYSAAQGLAYSQTVSTGPAPNAGAKAMQGLRRAHAGYAAGSGHKGALVSDTPALETQQPGYRRRA